MNTLFIKHTILKNGFTLIEVLLTLALFTFIVGGVVVLPPLFRESFMRQQVALDVNSDGDMAMQIILKDIRNAQKINPPQTGQTSSAMYLVLYSGVGVKYSMQNGDLLRCDNNGCVSMLNVNKVRCEKLVFYDKTATNGRKIVGIYLRLSHVYNNLGTPQLYYTKEFTATAMKQQTS